MHSNKLILSVIVALLSWSATYSQIHNAEGIASGSLNPVVITGSGHHQRLKQTATPVHVLSAKEIGEQGITTLDGALTRMMPQLSMAPSSMGSFLRLNGLSNKYILVLVNGHKLTGDISNNIDLNRINMARVKRIEVLDGAASSLYGSDAIAGVINIITDQPTQDLIAATSSTRVSGHGLFTEAVNLDIYTHGFGSYTSFTHDRADSYQNSKFQISTLNSQIEPTLAPLFTGYRSNLLGQKFTYAPTSHLALNTGIDYSYKITNRPDTDPLIAGGTDYEMRYKGLRVTAGGIYKFSARKSLQADFIFDHYRYGKEYDVATATYQPGDYVQSKKQRSLEGELKAILGFTSNSTTILGADWRNDYLNATSGNIDRTAYTLAAYAQHELKSHKFQISNFNSQINLSFGARYNYHRTFGSHFTPKVSAMYSVGHVNLRATYSSGFRAPGLDELYYHYFSVNRGKPQISFGNRDLRPERSNYFALNGEYRTDRAAFSLTGYFNRISDMVVKQNIAVDDEARTMLLAEFPEMTQDQADRLVSYALYQNSERGNIKGVQLNSQISILNSKLSTFNFQLSYAYTQAQSKVNGQWTETERSMNHSATMAADYHHNWGRYGLNINLNGRLQSKTYYTGDYENAPGFGVWNLQTTHRFAHLKHIILEASLGIDNLFNNVDRRIDTPIRKYALYSPGRMLVAGLKIKIK